MVNALLQCHTVSAEYQGQTSLVTLTVSLLALLSVPKGARQCLAGLPIDYRYLYLAGSYVQFGLPGYYHPTFAKVQATISLQTARVNLLLLPLLSSASGGGCHVDILTASFTYGS